MIRAERLINLFTELVTIDNPSLHEEKISARIQEIFRQLNITYTEDNAGTKIGGSCGNLHAYIDGDLPLPPLLFSAHMDSVDPGVHKKAIIQEGGKITSDGSTVLGADDLSGICTILEAITSIKEDGVSHRPIELLFDVAEETYCAGIQQFQFSEMKSKEAYVFDLTGSIGSAAYQAPAILSFRAEFTGKSAHAAFSPEDGIHAIKTACDAVSAIPCGRIGDTTVNIGTITGGSADNIVPSGCSFTGEVRGFDNVTVQKQISKIRDTVEEVARKSNTTVSFSTKPLCLAYRVDPEALVAKRFIKACEDMELPSDLKITYGGSDNNHFFQNGIKGLVVACGMNNCHGCQEYTYTEDLVRAASLAEALMRSKL